MAQFILQLSKWQTVNDKEKVESVIVILKLLLQICLHWSWSCLSRYLLNQRLRVVPSAVLCQVTSQGFVLTNYHACCSHFSVNRCWGTNFRVLILLAHSQNTHMSLHIILKPTLIFPIYIAQIFSMLLGLHKYFIHKAHKLPWADSQILPIITHILSKLGFHKNTHHIGPQNYTIFIKSPKARCYTAP